MRGCSSSAVFQSSTYLNKVLAFDDELDDSLGSNNSSIFLQNNLLQGKTRKMLKNILAKSYLLEGGSEALVLLHMNFVK